MITKVELRASLITLVVTLFAFTLFNYFFPKVFPNVQGERIIDIQGQHLIQGEQGNAYLKELVVQGNQAQNKIEMYKKGLLRSQGELTETQSTLFRFLDEQKEFNSVLTENLQNAMVANNTNKGGRAITANIENLCQPLGRSVEFGNGGTVGVTYDNQKNGELVYYQGSNGINHRKVTAPVSDTISVGRERVVVTYTGMNEEKTKYCFQIVYL